MTLRISAILIFITNVIFLGGCSGIQNKELLYRTDEVAFYTIGVQDIEGSEGILPPTYQHPIQISKENLKPLLGNLRFEQNESVGVRREYVFSESQLDLLCEDLEHALEALPRNRILVVVIRYDEQKSVMSNPERTTAFVWVSENKVNMLFGEVKTQLVSERISKEYEKWSDVKTISLSIIPNGLRIEPDSYFSYKNLNHFPDRQWIQIPIDKIGHIQLEHRLTLADETGKTFEMQDEEKKKNEKSPKSVPMLKSGKEQSKPLLQTPKTKAVPKPKETKQPASEETIPASEELEE